MEGLKVFSRSFVTDFETAEISEPAQRAFHDVTGSAQAAAMLMRGPAVRSEQRLDAALADLGDDGRGTVSCVSLEARGFTPGTSATTGDGRNFVEHRQGPVGIRFIGRPCLDDQGDTARVRNHMPFTALFGAVRGVGAGVTPPKQRVPKRCR